MNASLNSTQFHRHCIIVSLTESEASWQAMKLACQLASDRQAEMMLVYVIEVPMRLALNAPSPDAEEKANRLLDAGWKMVKEYDLKAESRTVRHRRAADALLKLARESGAATIVLGTVMPRQPSFIQIEPVAMELLRRAPCEVIVAKAPQPALEF